MYMMNTTPEQYIDNTILNVNDNGDINDNKSADQNMNANYKHIEIAIFSIVVALCFCTVFSFLAYLTFKRKVNNIQKNVNMIYKIIIIIIMNIVFQNNKYKCKWNYKTNQTLIKIIII